MTGLIFFILTQAPNPYLEEGRNLARSLHFAEAIEQLKVARQVPDLAQEQKIEVLELLARCQVAEGRREEAEDTYTELLGLFPGFELDEKAPPKMRELFVAVKHRLYPEPWLKLVRQPAGRGEARVKVIDPYHRVSRLTYVSRFDRGAWVTHTVAPSDGEVRLPLEVEAGHALDWYLEALDEQGAPLVSYGSAAQPQRVISAATGPELVRAETPRIRRAPAWVAVAVAVAAAGAGATLQAISIRQSLAAHDHTQPPGDWADTARAAQGRANTEAGWATGCFIGAGVAGAGAVVLFAW